MKKNSNTQTTEVFDKVSKRFYDVVLDKCVIFVGNGNAPDGSNFIITNDKIFGDMIGINYLAYSITRSFVHNRQYLPRVMQDESDKPFTKNDDILDLKQETIASLLLSVSIGDRKHAIKNAYKALDRYIVKGNYESRKAKTLPKEEEQDVDYREAVKDLCSSTPKIIEDYFVNTNTIYDLFDKVKKSHKFVPAKRWQCFEYFLLNIPNSQIAETLGISKQKASQNNREMVNWFIDELKKDEQFANFTKRHRIDINS